MRNRVFVLNKHQQPLMPCSPRTARGLLKQDKAKIIKLENNEIIIKSDVNDDYTNGVEILAQIVPEWANCSSDALDADSLEDVETSLANPYYDGMNEEKPADIFKTDYKLIFVNHDWASGEEQVSDRLADVMDLFTEHSLEKD